MSSSVSDDKGGGDFSVAGSPLANRLLRVWSEGYSTSLADRVNATAPQITLDDSSSSSGAARVCGVRRREAPVDVAAMMRPMNQLEASTNNGWEFDCVLSKRHTVQVEVGELGATIATGAQGPATDCVSKLGGLSFDQLRWMYSSWTESKLANELDGWERRVAVPHSDGNDDTRLWSELHADCQPVEIVTVGPLSNTPVHDFLDDRIFNGQGETFNDARYMAADSIQVMVAMLEAYGNAIGFLNIRYSLSADDSLAIQTLTQVPIGQQNNGVFTEPFLAKFNEGAQYPLFSRLVLNLNTEEQSMIHSRPFLDYALSQAGTDALLSAGFWPLPQWEQIVMKTRAETTSGIPLSDIRWFCGSHDSELDIAGSSTVFPVAQVWTAVYNVGCGANIRVEGGGSSSGAGRVCGDWERGSSVDIGDMSREWTESEAEASVDQEFLYNCKVGDPGRSVIQIPIAMDGITVSTKKEGAARDCIAFLGGLSTDQLRWIFSSYSEEQLVATGWDAGSVPNIDMNPESFLWSELDSRCPALEIRISGRDNQSGTFEFFFDNILTDHASGEMVDTTRLHGYFASSNDEALVRYMEEQESAVSFFSFAYYFQYSASLFAVPIMNDRGILVEPSSSTVGDGSYNPLSRNIYMNVLNDAESLEHTRGFVSFGLSTPELLSVATGYVASSGYATEKLLDRLEMAPYKGANIEREIHLGLTSAIVAGFFAIIVGCAIVADARYRIQWRLQLEERRPQEAAEAETKQAEAALKQKEVQQRSATKEIFLVPKEMFLMSSEEFI